MRAGVQVGQSGGSGSGEIASSKELLLEAGKETIAGGRYSVLDEVFADGILTVNFEVLH
jgi:hypothetical protein